MTEDWFAALHDGVEALNAGRSVVEVVDELIAAGGRETRLSAADGFCEYERAITSMPASPEVLTAGGCPVVRAGTRVW